MRRQTAYNQTLIPTIFPIGSMDTHVVQCPYCGQQIDVGVDPSVPYQEYIEDCQVCCRPITLSVTAQAGSSPRVVARTDDE